eukprot:288703_1
MTLIHVLFFAVVDFTLTVSLCSSIDYSDKIRSILSSQTDYDVYEGKLIFVQNATDFPGTNSNGIYGATYFGNISNLTDPHSIAPKYSYFMRSSNALIFPGCTPPKSVYFSINSYLLDRFTYNHSRYHRKVLWSDLGASLNNLVWNTSTPNISNNYDSLTIYIQTADHKTYNDIYTAFTANNISSNEINLQSLPNKYINFLPYKYNNKNLNEYNSSYDTAQILFRITIPENNKDYQTYINQQQTLFMLQPKNPSNRNAPRIPFEPVTRNPYSPDNFNESASNYSSVMNQYKMDLISYLQKTYNLIYKREMVIPCLNDICYGFCCIDVNANCGGETRDALYYQLNSNVTLFENNYFIIMGMMHTNKDIKQTVYSNIVYDDHIYRPYVHESNPSITNFEYNGSALILPVETDINKIYLENIFVVQLAHKYLCIDGLPGICTSDIGYGDLFIRNYLNPITKTRPDVSQIIHDIVIEFEKNLFRHGFDTLPQM